MMMSRGNEVAEQSTTAAPRLFLAAAAALAALAAALIASPAGAQQAPNAGTLLREFGPSGQPKATPTLPPVPLAPEETPKPAREGAKVLVKDFRIKATEFPEDSLKALVKDYVGRELTIGDLEDAALKISEYYREHDLLARAYLPKQTIENGVVEIDVLEARLGAVTVDPASRTRLDPDIAIGIVRGRAPTGEVLRPSDLEEGVAIVNEIPGVVAKATLVPGSAAGETNADLTLADRPLVSSFLVTDDAGVRWSGSHRVVGSTTVSDPLGLGEQLSLAALWTSGSEYDRLAFQMPAGDSGLTLGINGSNLEYSLGSPFNVLNEGGYAYTGGVTASYPIRRAPGLALTAVASFDHKRLVDWALGSDTADRALEVGSFHFLGLVTDKLLGGGVNDFNAGVSVGTLNRSGNALDLLADKLTARTHGGYSKLTAALSRSQQLFADTTLFFSVNLQYALKNLESSEKLSLGGPGGVRAYPVNEANGDSGAIATLELRHDFSGILEIAGFYDVGGILQHQESWKGWQSKLNEADAYVLQGPGIEASLRPTFLPALRAKFTVARAIGINPGRDLNGNNSDGKHGRNRYWFQISYSF